MVVIAPIESTKSDIVATNVTEDEFMQHYAESFHEWIDGTVIKLSPIHMNHDKLSRFLAFLIEAYLEERPVGQLRQAPFVMRLPFEAFDDNATEDDKPKTKYSRREPDLQLILNDNPNTLTPTFMDGPADIAIEIVSPESRERDYAEKLFQYEQGGVSEYWVIDPIREACRFYHLDARQAYVLQADVEIYTTSRLPDFQLHVPTLWQSELPKPSQIMQIVAEMLN